MAVSFFSFSTAATAHALKLGDDDEGDDGGNAVDTICGNPSFIQINVVSRGGGGEGGMRKRESWDQCWQFNYLIKRRASSKSSC